jgi:hypothetical protein
MLKNVDLPEDCQPPLHLLQYYAKTFIKGRTSYSTCTFQTVLNPYVQIALREGSIVRGAVLFTWSQPLPSKDINITSARSCHLNTVFSLH